MLPCFMSFASWLITIVAFFISKKVRIRMVVMFASLFLRQVELMLTRNIPKFLYLITNRANSSKVWTYNSFFSPVNIFLNDLDLSNWGTWVSSILLIDLISCWVVDFCEDINAECTSFSLDLVPFLVLKSSKQLDL